MADAELTTTGADGDLGGETTTSSKCISCGGAVLSERERPCSIKSVSEPGFALPFAVPVLSGPVDFAFEVPALLPAAPFAGLLTLAEVGDASSMLLVSLSSAASSSEMEPSVKESSSRSAWS